MCNIGYSTFNVVFGIFLSVLGFRVMCAIYGRLIQHPGIQIGKIQVGNGNQGSQVCHNGNFTGTFLCFLHGDIPVLPISGI